jgi:bifunctional DNase/RNase
MLEAVLEDVAVAGDGTQFLVLLKTNDNRFVPIAIGPLEAMSIAAGRAKESVARPMTHDLMLSVMDMLDAKLKRIEVTDLRDGVFYARLIIENRGIEYDIDARPSDALGLAVRAEVPLLIAEKVVDMAAMSEFEDGPGGVQA